MDSPVRSGPLRAAPPVQIDVRPDPFWRAFCAVLAAVAAANVALWVAALEELPSVVMLGLAMAAAAATGWVMLQLGTPRESAQLHWDGACWHRRVTDRLDQPQRGDVRPVVDLGPWLLLRFVPESSPSRAAWLPLLQRAVGPRWLPLRTAVYARRPDLGSSFVQPPSSAQESS